MGADDPRLVVDEWLTRREAALYARVSLSTLDRARRAGHVRSEVAHGSRRVRRFRRSWLDTWLAHGEVVLACVLATMC